MRRLPVLLVGAVLVPLLGSAPAAADPAPADTESYIVVLQDGTDAEQAAEEHGADPTSVYEHALDGYAAEMTAAEVEELRSDPDVAYVHEDAVVHTTAQTTPTGIERIFAPDNPSLAVNGTDDFRADADIAVIDTGIAPHPDLDIAGTTDCTSGVCQDGSGTDGNGHGTHVAGSAAALDNGDGVVGVANGARVWGVKVLGDNGSGSLSAVTAGIDWVTGNADEIEVANLSLGCQGCTDQAMSQAITESVDSGVAYAVAAGNNAVDAADFFPANHPDVLTVSALADSDGAPGGDGGAFTCRTDQDDTLADFSNYGTVVDVAAPGVCIESTWPGGGYNSISGTSMAAPHVAGALALLAVGDAKPTGRADVLALYDTVRSTGSTDWDDTSGDGVTEPLLDVGDPAHYPADGGGTEPGAPTAVATHTCDDATLTCDFDGSASADPDGDIAAHTWDFGDGATGDGATATHTYAEAGTYTAELTVTDADGNTDTATTVVEVGAPSGNEPPTAAFTATCLGFWGLCLFDATGSTDADGDVAAYSWSYGDGTTGGGATPLHAYARAGTYTVTLTVTDDEGATGTASRTLNVR
jgi:subtilisin family serine protease